MNNFTSIKEVATSDLLGGLTPFEEKHAPKVLYIQGDRDLINDSVRVSVVGTRKPTPEGRKRAEVIVKGLVKRGITVVSGLAAGIDSVAHKTAIENNGKTIAVLGTSLDITFPAENKELLECIKKDHLAVSQFPVGYPSMAKNFPIRNRTMALLSDATIIVEAGKKVGPCIKDGRSYALEGCYSYWIRLLKTNH